MTDEDASQSHRCLVPLRRPLPPPRVRHPTVAQLLAQIRFLAADTSTVIFSDHAQERMCERGITPEDVYFVLRFGDNAGPISPGIDAGEWKCKVVGQPRGARQVGAVVIVLVEGKLFVKTVEWEDR